MPISLQRKLKSLSKKSIILPSLTKSTSNQLQSISEVIYRKNLALPLGHVGAKYEMALIYLEGKILRKNSAMAVKLLREAVAATEGKLGYNIITVAKAQNQLGTCYLRGLGVKKSAKTAAHWYKLAAMELNSDALENYAKLLSSGNGVRQDKVAAHAYQRLSDLFSKEENSVILYDRLKVIPHIYRVQSTRDNKKLPLMISPQYPVNKPQEFSPATHLIMG